MKLIKSAKNRYQFQLATREKELLLHILSLYPRIPSSYQPLSKKPVQESNQRLLDEALAERRAQNKKRLDSLLGSPKQLKQAENNWTLALSSDEVDWLLEVLNDVRIGSWVHLGCPDPTTAALNAESAPHLWAMEMAGYFQMRFLELIDS